MPVKLRSPLMILSRVDSETVLISRTRQLSLNLLRYQSTYTFPESAVHPKSKRGGKVKQVSRRAACTLQSVQTAKAQAQAQMEVPLRTRKKYRYHPLPSVPSTQHIEANDMCTELLYSGYRPLFLDSTALERGLLAAKEQASFTQSASPTGSTFYEIAMKLEDPACIWANSATGLEKYTEWDNIPYSVANSLKPFVPPSSGGHAAVKAAAGGSARALDVLLTVQNLLSKNKTSEGGNARGGRKKPVLTVLDMKKDSEES
ncbi:Pet20p KNAG_0J01760 [Huiozyma naganishii CBS 8797]|uniref:Uncharacterized protein n=1 Tax=Huiozyma naganishii (strain ATCC MYA-139 / BCRC 22969 / CBS 8797 / KCTC 17520 / NBRC 10181 / NCYC 3082 / Yp74L-3) TaxID=1071383 RepID=J7S2V3_HUIN7|nr:hypothetical protein KNAG_0J01760 [Kazachstania naganishii CBS 8797]CCK72257.1 hypothetical protein KNAG_0J01760 [Kazachstania naganishii CBS 8797]